MENITRPDDKETHIVTTRQMSLPLLRRRCCCSHFYCHCCSLLPYDYYCNYYCYSTYYHCRLSHGWNDEKDRAPSKQSESLNIPEHRQPLINNRSAKSTGKPRPTQTTSNMKTQKYANTNLPSRTRQCQIKTGDKARIPHHLECHLSHQRSMSVNLSSYRLKYHGQSMCILGMSISICHLVVATHHIQRRSLQF